MNRPELIDELWSLIGTVVGMSSPQGGAIRLLFVARIEQESARAPECLGAMWPFDHRIIALHLRTGRGSLPRSLAGRQPPPTEIDTPVPVPPCDRSARRQCGAPHRPGDAKLGRLLPVVLQARPSAGVKALPRGRQRPVLAVLVRAVARQKLRLTHRCPVRVAHPVSATVSRFPQWFLADQDR